MARRGGWRRIGGRRRFRYVDSRGDEIVDEERLGRIERLVIPPAWRDVWISPSPGAKLQATGVDAAGRRQYLYHPAYRAAREQEKFDRLVRFGELLPGLRKRMAMDVDRGPYEHDWTCAIAVTLVQPRLVPRRLGPLRTDGAHVRHHDADEATRHRAKGPDHLPLPRQARRPGTDDTRRRGARRRRSRAAALRRRGAAAALRARRAAHEPDGAGAEPLHRRAPRRRLHGEGLSHVGRHAHGGRAARRARSAHVGRRRSRASSLRSCEASGKSSATRRRSRAPRTSARR